MVSVDSILGGPSSDDQIGRSGTNHHYHVMAAGSMTDVIAL